MIAGYDLTNGLGWPGVALMGLFAAVLLLSVGWGLRSMFQAQADLARQDREREWAGRCDAPKPR